MTSIKSIGIVYNALLPTACNMTSVLEQRLGLKERGWVCPASEIDSMADIAAGTELIVTVGGDGTILRAVKLCAPLNIPILGINMGRLGFMTELKGDEALEKLPHYLDSNAWVEERLMLRVQVLMEGRPETYIPPYHALNDAVIGRISPSHLISVNSVIDGGHFTTYRADAVIIATATGSTGYNLAVGGPILYPRSKDMVIKPVAPHLGLATGLVVPSTSVMEFTVESGQAAMLSVDGYADLPLTLNDAITIQASDYKARFLRINPPMHFYHTLTQRLDFGGAPGKARPGSP